jgi:hypothetical protein
MIINDFGPWHTPSPAPHFMSMHPFLVAPPQKEFSARWPRNQRGLFPKNSPPKRIRLLEAVLEAFGAFKRVFLEEKHDKNLKESGFFCIISRQTGHKSVPAVTSPVFHAGLSGLYRGTFFLPVTRGTF